MKMFALVSALLTASGVFAGATSVNAFGVLKVLSTTTNTIVTIPWTAYSQEQTNAAAIFSPKLVKPTNLTVGDTIMWLRGDDRFDVWVLNGRGEWEGAAAVSSLPFGGGSQMDVTPDNVRIARGYGFWLQRQHPYDVVDGKKVPVPFWLFGQAVTNKATSVIGGGTVETPCCTMLANPWAGAVKVNELPWKDVNEGTGISDCDTLVLPNGGNGSDYVYRRNGKWTFSQIETYTDAKGRVRSRTTYTEDITIPAGQGFWYVRRKPEPTTIDWPEDLVPTPESASAIP